MSLVNRGMVQSRRMSECTGSHESCISPANISVNPPPLSLPAPHVQSVDSTA